MGAGRGVQDGAVAPPFRLFAPPFSPFAPPFRRINFALTHATCHISGFPTCEMLALCFDVRLLRHSARAFSKKFQKADMMRLILNRKESYSRNFRHAYIFFFHF